MIAKAHNMNDKQIRMIVYGLLQAGLIEVTRPAGAKSKLKSSGRSRPRSTSETPEVKARVVNKLIDRIKSL